MSDNQDDVTLSLSQHECDLILSALWKASQVDAKERSESVLRALNSGMSLSKHELKFAFGFGVDMLELRDKIEQARK